MGLYSILACPVLLDYWDFFIIPVLFYHEDWKADCISCQVHSMGVEALFGGKKKIVKNEWVVDICGGERCNGVPSLADKV